MHKDVKRSLVIWPLVASVIVTATCWMGMQSDPASRMLLSRAKTMWDSGGQRSAVRPARASVTAVQITKVQDKVRSVELPKVSVGTWQAQAAVGPKNESSIWTELAAIESWNDTSLEVQQPVVAGIPAPSLDNHSDLFGFDASLDHRDLDDTLSVPVLELTAEEENRVAVDLAGPELPVVNQMVIQIDPDVFFADDAPLSAHPVDDPFDAGSPRLAERPTDVVALPSAFEAPESVVADLAPELDVAEVIPGKDRSNSILSETEIVDRPIVENPYTQSADEDERPEIPAITRDEQSDSPRDLAKARSATWPVAHRLLEQLDLLDRIAEQTQSLEQESSFSDTVTADDLIAWSASVRQSLQQLPAANRLGDAEVEPLLAALDQAQTLALIEAESLQSPSRRVAWLQAAYSIQRRLAVWRPIFEINSGDFPVAQHVGDDVLGVAAAIDRLHEELPSTGDAAGWASFLLLDELREVFESGDDQSRRELAQKFLARLTWPNLAAPHQQFLAGQVVTDVAVAIRPWASGAMDYSALLHQIEKAESNAIDLVTAEVARSMQSLEHANHPKATLLAANLDTHYRNANVRFSLSDELLQSLLPEIPTRNVPVRTTMLGSRVTGVSQINSDLHIQLIPSPSTWELILDANGKVATRSVGRRGPAAVSTSSVNPFSASTPISIKPTDIQLGNSSVNVGGRTRLRGVNTSYDGWPLIGSLVKNFAESEYFDKETLANRIGRNRIRTELSNEMEQSLRDKVDSATDRFSKTILGPLTDLQLEPKVVDMSTTASRLVARYRMAGDWQLAAMTPRPRALADNLFSVQIHQSAINNTLENLVPQDEVLPIDAVLRQSFDVMGLAEVELPEDLPEDAEIQFAKHRPITIEIEDGKVWITMRVIRLQRGKNFRLRNFIVRAAYLPQVDGLNASLVRDGHLSISGPGMSMRQRLPVRAIFNKVLSPNRPLPLTSAGLLANRMPEQSGITQFELRDGWIGISVGKMAENQRVATRPAGIR